MLEKLKTGIWFAKRPSHWLHSSALLGRKFQKDMDGPVIRDRAAKWAAERAVSVGEALSHIRLLDKGQKPPAIPKKTVEEGAKRAKRSPVAIGGAGNIHLLYAAVILSNSTRIVETDVAYGWSSLAILSASKQNSGLNLVSVDMPYPKANHENYVGIVVPDRLRQNWQIIREPDRRGLEKAIAVFKGEIDLCHYDSDKTWHERQYGFRLLWSALKAGGIFISDDIQDNVAFAEFADELGLPFEVTESEKKYIGIIRKPQIMPPSATRLPNS